MMGLLIRLGATTLQSLAGLGRLVLFVPSLLWALLPALPRFRLIFKQIMVLGVRSLLIILIAGFFIGAVLSLQGYTNLVAFGAEASLGVVVALSLIRELGPVLTALLYVGRAGSSLTAEIGHLKATEQLTSMELMGVDPTVRVLAPRFWAGMLVVPLLTAIFTAIGILGAYGLAVTSLGIDGGIFWGQMQMRVEFWRDIWPGIIVKSVAFALVIHLIALFNGFDAVPTSEGISQALTRTVVNSSLAVLGLDFLLTAWFFGG